MPISNPTEAAIFNTDYATIGEYVQDDAHFLYYNPTAADLLFRPGEPICVRHGAVVAGSTTADEEWAMMCQDAIRPGGFGNFLRYFTADFSCNFSGNAIVGQEVWWDFTNEECKLEADITNGWILGYLTFAKSSIGTLPSVDGNNRVIGATSSSTKCRVTSLLGPTTTKGTVTIY